MTVLVIEDDPSVSTAIKLGLERAGHEVVIASTGTAGVAAITSGTPSCVLLDLGLPEISGRQILRSVREAGNNVPIIVLTGYDAKASVIGCLKDGADDYVTKPFGLPELSGRIDAVMRRAGSSVEQVLRAGELQISMNAREATYAGRTIKLTAKEFALLELMMTRKGTVVTKEAILDYLYGGMDEPEMKIIDVFICKVRAKLKNVAPDYSYIHTVWGRGYRLSPEVSDVSVA